MARIADDATEGGFERGQAAVVAPTAEYPLPAGPSSEPPSFGSASFPPPSSEPPSSEPAPARPPGGGFPRSLFWLAATVALVLAIVVGVKAVGLWPSLSNPFASRQTDRSQPVLLKSIQDLSRFVAAEGNFEVIVDLKNDTKYIPDFLVSDSTLFVAAGTVEAYVDFSGLGQGAIIESADHKTVEIKLPAPALGKPNIDNDRSYVYSNQKGLLNHLRDLVKDDPNQTQQLYQKAEEKISASATDSGLADRAKENTTKMLDGMLRSLGYTTVKVTFAAP